MRNSNLIRIVVVATSLLAARSVSAPPAASRPASAPAFHSSDLEFAGGAPDVTLAATLLVPVGASADARVPGVVLISGSGLQDRDETILGRKPFRVLAEALAARGYAVLRYDDRGSKAAGVGASTGSAVTATLADTALDARAALRFLAARPEVDARRVVACGHSTGGLEVAMLLRAEEVSGAAVLLAAPTVSGATLLELQSVKVLAAAARLGQLALTEGQLEAAGRLQSELVRAYLAGDDKATRAAAEAAVRFNSELQPAASAPTGEAMDRAASAAIAAFKSPWMDHFLRYDPAPDLAASRVPVLAIFGSLDLQVPPEQNAQPAVSALTAASQPASAVVTLIGRNHLFQTATSGHPAEYGRLKDEMPRELTELIADWLDRVVGR